MLVKRVAFLFMAILATVPTCFGLPDTPFQLNPAAIPSSGIPSLGILICSDPVSCISSFVSAFTKTVQSSKILTNVFDTSQTSPSIFKRFLYDYIFTSAPNPGLAFPHFTANDAFQPLEEYFNFLAAPIMAKVFANAAANYLHSEGLLNPTNAASLGLAYAKAVEEIAKSNIMDGHDELKLKSVTDGFQKFLTSLGLLVTDKRSSIASHFGNQVKLAREALRRKFSY
ncbi:hypothetical protein AVEN_239495-1 [Araneus ventricosus]|uniref:Tubuliform egg casing silk strands structural domain-containing protein n=1 Tax=Araneus ventricosus TaxID=182803 RepID=A0A4Y2IL81_ARAVE|nr:hypothetical protein AVEN_239495-1 [Araneus ventricosus]